MVKVLVTAFSAYDVWQENSSWLALVELTRSLPVAPQITTRLYPVQLEAMRTQLAKDVEDEYDVALLLGQAPGSAQIRLEAIGLNVATNSCAAADGFTPLDIHGPVAYRSELPLASLANRLRDEGIPAQVSYHAGTYLCNAALYLAHLLIEQQGLKTKAAFVHLPLDPSQIVASQHDLPSLPAQRSAEAIRVILRELVG